MLGYRRPAANEAMLISGGRHGHTGAPLRVVTGHGAFVMPIFRQPRYLTLARQEAQLEERCVNSQGVTLRVHAVVAFKPAGL